MAKHYTTVEIKKLRELSATMSGRQVAEILNRPVKGVYLAAFRNGISFRCSRRRKYTAKDRAKVLELRKSGHTYPQIEQLTGVRKQTAMNMCLRYL